MFWIFGFGRMTDIVVEEVPIEVRSLVMVISHLPIQVYVEDPAEEPSQEHVQEQLEEHQVAKKNGSKKKSAKRINRPKKRIHDTDLSDFEVTDGEEVDIFLENDEERIRQAKKDTMKRL